MGRERRGAAALAAAGETLTAETIVATRAGATTAAAAAADVVVVTAATTGWTSDVEAARCKTAADAGSFLGGMPSFERHASICAAESLNS